MKSAKKYICPMHPEVISDKRGRCPKCGMRLAPEEEVSLHTSHSELSERGLGELSIKNYIPLVVILSLILFSSLAIAFPAFSTREILTNFMVGFFIVFSGFKLIDLKGFAEGYSTYDLLALRWYPYGYIYPFIELFFGLSMILGIYEQQVLIAEVIIMTFSGVGVLLKILKREKFQCVCLGTFLKVPLTYVTLIEDFGMAAIALILLFLV